MAGKLPLFASAPRAAIYLNDKKVAYAVGLSLNCAVNLQEVRILGEFAIQSIEATGYLPVSGTFQVVRLLSQASQNNYKTAAASLQNDMTGDPSTADLNDVTALSNSVPNTGTSGSGGMQGQVILARHLDPRTVLASQSFDIELKLKVPVISNLSDPKTAYTIPTTVPFDMEESFLIVKDCRLIGASASISPQQLLTESVEFQGLLMINQARPGIKENFDSNWKDTSLGS